jgi:hypothetical protein
MEFEWDADKSASNLAKHGVTFAEAMTVFGDPRSSRLWIQTTRRTNSGFSASACRRLGNCSWSHTLNAKGGPGSSTPVRRLPENGDIMNRHVHHDDNDDMRPEYDFSQGVRGKHYEAYRAGTNVVFLDPDVAKVFTDSASVNQVLRLLLQLARTNVPVETRPDKAPLSANRPRRGGKKPRTA